MTSLISSCRRRLPLATGRCSWPANLRSTRDGNRQKMISERREHISDQNELASDPKRVHILGLGNVGCFIAHELTSLPNPPPITLLFHRPSLLTQWTTTSNSSITLTTQTTKTTTSNYTTELLSPTTKSPIHNLLLCTKATKSQTALNSISNRLLPTSTVISTQNGLPIPQSPSTTIIPSINTHGLFTTSPFNITLASTSSTLTLPKPSKQNYLLDLLSSPKALNIQTVEPQEFECQKWEKLVINACINPLTVLFACKNGELFTQSPIVQLMRLLLSEISQLLLSLPEIRKMDKELDLETRFSIEELEIKVLDVADKTAANTSSMLQDVLNHLETEIDYITGYLVRRGEDCGVDMHFNAQVLSMVKEGRTLKAEDVVSEFGGGGGYLGALFDPLGWVDPRNFH